MSKNVAELQREIDALMKQRDEAEKREKQIATLPIECRVAIILHNNLCRHNHADECSWCYEMRNGEHDFTQNQHKYWRAVAQKRIINLYKVAVLNEETTIAVIQAIVEKY